MTADEVKQLELYHANKTSIISTCTNTVCYKNESQTQGAETARTISC